MTNSAATSAPDTGSGARGAAICDTTAAPFTPETLTAYLHDHIPLTGAMALTATAVSWTRVDLHAAIGPNLNHNRTAFGGSLASALTMAGWSMVHNRLRTCGFYARNPRTQLVVSRSETRYLHPTAEDFTVTCEYDDPKAWDHFIELLTRKGRGKLRLTAYAGPEKKPLCIFKAAYVAIADA